LVDAVDNTTGINTSSSNTFKENEEPMVNDAKALDDDAAADDNISNLQQVLNFLKN
jgi:hypothetical protein